MKKIYILVVDDEASVIDIVTRDLSEIEAYFPIETASDGKTARERIYEIEKRGGRIGLVLCDHIMPGETGVDLLIWMHAYASTNKSIKVLLTGQAGLDSTVKALNQAGLASYIGKPWKAENLVRVVRQQMSEYILQNGIDPKPLLPALDMEIMGRAIRKGLFGDA